MMQDNIPMTNTSIKRPKVSIMLITYNHEKYIAQALESILMQETEYDFEIAVIEDCSTDKTQEIIMRYVEKYPHKVKPYFNKKNIGHKITQKNFFQGYFRLTGDYMAILEGDDYWTSPHKLQKQISFLEKNPDYVACSHNTIKIYEDGSKAPHRFLYYEPIPADHTIEGFIMLSSYFHITTLMFRNIFRGAPPRHFRNKWSCEIFVVIAHAQFGKVRYFNEDMAAYRAHTGGRFSTMPILQGWFFNIGGLRLYNQWVNYRYLKTFSRSIIRYCSTLLSDKGKEAALPTRYQYLKYAGIRAFYQMIYSILYILDTFAEISRISYHRSEAKFRILSLRLLSTLFLICWIPIQRIFVRLEKVFYRAIKPLLPVKFRTRETIKVAFIVTYKAVCFLLSESMKNKIRNYEASHPRIRELRQLAAQGKLFTLTRNGINIIKRNNSE